MKDSSEFTYERSSFPSRRSDRRNVNAYSARPSATATNGRRPRSDWDIPQFAYRWHWHSPWDSVEATVRRLTAEWSRRRTVCKQQQLQVGYSTHRSEPLVEHRMYRWSKPKKKSFRRCLTFTRLAISFRSNEKLKDTVFTQVEDKGWTEMARSSHC